MYQLEALLKKAEDLGLNDEFGKVHRKRVLIPRRRVGAPTLRVTIDNTFHSDLFEIAARNIRHHIPDLDEDYSIHLKPVKESKAETAEEKLIEDTINQSDTLEYIMTHFDRAGNYKMRSCRIKVEQKHKSTPKNRTEHRISLTPINMRMEGFEYVVRLAGEYAALRSAKG